MSGDLAVQPDALAMGAQARADLARRVDGFASERGNPFLVAADFPATEEELRREPPHGTGYSDEVTGQICILVAQGWSIQKIVQVPGMPGITSIYRWLGKHEEFYKRLRQSRRLQAETLVERALDIAWAIDETDAKAAKIKAELLLDIAERRVPAPEGKPKLVQHDHNVRITHEQALVLI